MSAASPSTASALLDTETALFPSDFDPSLSEDEKRFYAKAYPSIELVRERKVHCTTCKCHIGTAPSQENSIKMHPVLRVTHCNKCHDFYNSGEFSKGEDGSELYCRWCGQGGEVYCCSNCPYVFCKSCIVKNLSRGVVADIENNENWSCFNCAPKILWPLRAQHWALIKYIEKQKKAIAAMNLSEADAKQEMLKDRSTCCRLAKAKCGNMSDSMESIDSLSRRSVSGASTGSASKKAHKLASRSQSPAAKRPKSNNDEVVCTPDLLSMLEPDCQITVSAKPRPTQSPMASSPKVMSIQNPGSYGGGGGGSSMHCSTPKNTPPPLVLRNTSVQMRPMTPTPIVRRTVVGPRSATAGGAAPVYHTINGYRIDLNSAAQQETFRLPNGKLIQVKRQGASINPPPNPVQSTPQSPQQQQQQQQQQHNAWQRNIQMQQQSRPVQIAPAHQSSSQQYPQITIQQHAPQQHPQMLRYQNTMVGNTTVTALHNGSSAQIHVINGAPGAQPQQQHPAPQQQAVQQPPARPLMVRHVFPDSAIGQARTQLQDQVFNAMEICQHLTGKVQTLTNSNAYKQARNYLEVKELYIHLSYLLTYAIGRFKGLQDKCLGDMRQLGFVNDADSLENGQLAAGVDYVRYGQLEDVELFNTGCNSFHNQVYEYRKSLHANLDKDGDEKPLSPLQPLGTCFIDNDDSDVEELKIKTKKEIETLKRENVENSEMLEHDTMPQQEEESMYNSYMGGDEENVDYTQEYDAEDDYDMSRPGGSVEVIRRENESHSVDRKLTRLIEQYPSIWCTRHPDYGNFEITRKYWHRISTHFSRNENIKLRWKNIRKRFVRIEDRLKTGKRFNGYYDKATNFLFNRNLAERDWMEVDKGPDAGSFYDTGSESWQRSSNANYSASYNDFEPEEQENDESDFRSSSVKPVDINSVDMKIINFVKCNPVLWRKATDPTCHKIDEQTRRTLWMHLWKQLPALNCEKLMDRWAHLYELYKTFRLKHIKNEATLANLEVKYSKYLATLHFLYKIDEDDLKNENLLMEDCGNLDELPEHDLKLQEMPDDREFVAELVRAVFKRTPLWNQKHPDYNDTTRREELWTEIEDSLKLFGRDVKTIKLRWHLAKFCYLRLCREKIKYPKDELPKYCINMPLDDMKFLKNKQASDDEDNEIEIVEPKTDTINLDSDNEDEEPQAAVSNPSPNKSALQIALTQPKSTLQIAPPVASATNPPVLSEIDIMSTAQSFLASMLEVDLPEGDLYSAQASPNGGTSGGASGGDATQKKQPRKKTTHKPNPTLLKQKEILERERLEEMKRNDMKLKMKCTIELKKAEEEYPFAKNMLGTEEGTANTNRKDDENEEVEVLLVEDVDSSLEEEKEKPKTIEIKVPKNQEKEGSRCDSEKNEIELKTKTKAEVKEMKEDSNSGTEKKTKEVESAVLKVVIIKSSSIDKNDDEKTENETTKLDDKIAIVDTVLTTSKEQKGDKNLQDNDVKKKEESTTESVDVEMPESETKNEKNNTEAEDLNALESKDIEMIEVPEEEEEEDAEKETANKSSNKEDAAVEPPPEVEDKEKITKSADALKVENVSENTETENSLLNGDDELNEQIEKILKTRGSEASKNIEVEDSCKKEQAEEPESESKKAEASTTDDLMDDINELIGNAMT